MTIVMSRYFSCVEIHLMTGKRQMRVRSYGKTQAEVDVLGAGGEKLCELSEEQVKDILAAMKDAKKAAGAADDAAPYISRDDD